MKVIDRSDRHGSYHFFHCLYGVENHVPYMLNHRGTHLEQDDEKEKSMEPSVGKPTGGVHFPPICMVGGWLLLANQVPPFHLILADRGLVDLQQPGVDVFIQEESKTMESTVFLCNGSSRVRRRPLE